MILALHHEQFDESTIMIQIHLTQDLSSMLQMHLRLLLSKKSLRVVAITNQRIKLIFRKVA